jgi:hypothetical protein
MPKQKTSPDIEKMTPAVCYVFPKLREEEKQWKSILQWPNTCDSLFGIDVFKTARGLGLPIDVLKDKNEIQNRYGFVLID